MGAKEHHLTSPRLSNSSGHHFTPFFPTFNPTHPLSYPIPPKWVLPLVVGACWAILGIKKPPVGVVRGQL